jgi:uncharacterized integral membrane protein
MKKIKIAVWVIILGFLALIVYQNQSYFTDKHSFKIDLVFAQYSWPEVGNFILLLACFILGYIIAVFFGLSHRMKSRKEIKRLLATVDSHLEKISDLRNELEALRSGSTKRIYPEDKGDIKEDS